MTTKLKILSFLFDTGMNKIPPYEQEKYIKKLGKANTDIERSYKQYKCQRLYMPFYIRFINDLISIISTPFFIVFYFIKGFIHRRKEYIQCIGDLKNFEEIIPDSLLNKYNVNNEVWFSGAILKFSDIKYICSIILKYPCSPLFIFKIIYKIARYSYMINTYNNNVFIVHNEFSFTSSLLTDYCHRNYVKHINVMHGEKGYVIRDSYFHFDQCYVWDKYYIDLFISLNAEPYQFIIEKPKSMLFNIELHKDSNSYADYKYYLAKSTPEELNNIVESMNFAKKQGKTVKYRLHPRYSDKKLVEKIIGKENIEYPSETNIIKSLSNCGCAVAVCSTVLTQAYNNNIPVILDDLTQKEYFKKLKQCKYILINKGLPLLSEKQ